MRPALKLTYSPGWVLLSAYLAMVSFLLALVELSFVHPLIFEGPLTARALWAGLLMPVPLWFFTHQALLLVLRAALWPLGWPGRLEISEDGVSLRQGRGLTTLAWPRIVEVRTSDDPLDLDVASGVHPAGRAGAAAAAALAAKQWQVIFEADDGARIVASSRGFRRPFRRAEPQLRAWLEHKLGASVAPLSEPRRYAVTEGT